MRYESTKIKNIDYCCRVRLTDTTNGSSINRRFVDHGRRLTLRIILGCVENRLFDGNDERQKFSVDQSMDLSPLLSFRIYNF